MAMIRTTPQFIELDHPLVARALLRHIVEHADVVGDHYRGRPIMRFEFAADPWMVDKLVAMGAGEENLEDEVVE
jgi:hypothetical protein